MQEHDQEIKLKKGVFGYSSKDVDDYLLEVTAKYDGELRKRDTRISELTRHVAELTEKLGSYERERLDVANTLVVAQQKAQAMLDNAVKDVEAKKAELCAEIADYERRRDQAREALNTMRKESLELVRKYQAIVDAAARIEPEKKEV